MRPVKKLVLTGCATVFSVAWSSPYIQHIYDCHALTSITSIAFSGQFTEEMVLGQDSLWRIGQWAYYARSGDLADSGSLMEYSQSRFENLASLHFNVQRDPELLTTLMVNLANDYVQCYVWGQQLFDWLVKNEQEAITELAAENRNYFVNAQFNHWLPPETDMIESETELSESIVKAFYLWQREGYPGPMTLVANSLRNDMPERP